MTEKIDKAILSEISEKSVLSRDENENKLPQEVEKGNCEYKRQLVNVSKDRFEQLVSQLKWRLSEGQGEAIYELGVSDDGFPIGLNDKDFAESVSTLQRMVKELSADVTLLLEKDVSERGNNNSPSKDKKIVRKRVAEFLIRHYGEDNYLDLRIAVCGSVDSGKSSLIGVLIKGELDDGNGKARSNVFVHQHEILSGRTSAISYQILGYDIKGGIVNYSDLGTVKWKDIVEKSSKIITFIDLAGHSKYLKTTVFGMTGSVPDYAILIISASSGIPKMTKEHLGLCLHLKIPVFVIITKIDICVKSKLERTLGSLKKILKLPGVRKIPYEVKKKSDIVLVSKSIVSDNIVPIFLVSNVTGENMELLKTFLNVLPVRRDWITLKKQTFEFMVDQTYQVSGIGTVLSGLVLQGEVSLNDKCMLGPFENGNFEEVQIKGIHHKRTKKKYAKAGQHVTLALRENKKLEIRKGMVVVEEKRPRAVWQFEAEVLVLYHKTRIKLNYEAVVHILSVKQTAKVVKMNEKELRTGDKSVLVFKFLFRPEFVKKNSRIIFRAGQSKGIGTVTKVYYENTVEEKKKVKKKQRELRGLYHPKRKGN